MMVVIAGTLLITAVLSVLYLTATRRIASRETEAGDALPPGVPGRLIRVGAHRVHVVERGVGPAILLVHGTAGTTLGEADDIIPVRAATSLRRLVKNSEMVVIDGAGHFSMQDSPQRFVQEVRRFLDAQPPPER